MIHDFKECLERSNNYSNEPWWEGVYKNAFPTMKEMVNIPDDGWAQRAGIDRILILNSGKTLYIDEKVRESSYNDILLEYWSSIESKIPGWIAKDLATDFIAYVFKPTKKCYMLPFQLLRLSWKKNHREWVKNHRIVEAKNKNYTTVSVCVPIEILLESIKKSILIEW